MKHIIYLIPLIALTLLSGSPANAQVIYPNRGGLGTSTVPSYGQIPVGNVQGTYTLTSTSSLGITGGGGATISTDPLTATYFVATGTATSTFPKLSVTTALNILGEYITDLTTWVRGKVDAYLSGGEGVTYSSGAISFDCSEVEGSGINCTGEDITLDATGDWTGTLDGLNGSDFLSLSAWYATTTDGLDEGSTNRYYTDARVGSYISGSSTVPHIGGSATGDILRWTGSGWGTMATSGINYQWGNLGGIPAGFWDGVDDTGSTLSGGSTNVLTYWTNGSTVGATTSPTVGYVTATSTTPSRIPYASSTAISATTFYGALTGNALTATALGANGSNCSAGQAALGVDASGAVETCFDVWTEAENTTAAYLNAAGVNSYIHSSTTIPKTYTANTFTGLQTIGNASTTHLSVSGNSYLGTVRTGTWNGTSIGDAYVDDTITASNYLTLSAWYATTTQDIAESGNLYYTDARAGSYISGSSTVPHIGGSALGDLLYWTGTAWGTRATSTLGISWNDLRSVPAGFADGVDNEGSGGSAEHTDAGAYVYPNDGDYHSAPYYAATTTTGTSTFTNAVQIGGTAGDSALKIAAGRVYSASNSVGGLLNLSNGTTNTGPALVAYTNVTTSAGNLANFRCDNASMAHDCLKIDHDGTGDGLAIAATGAASNALSLSNTGVDHTLNVAYTGSTADKGAMNLTSTNADGSVFQIVGNANGLGVGKITHNAAGDAGSSILSLAASHASYAGQGIFLDMNTVGNQKLLNLRADGTEVFTLTADGKVDIDGTFIAASTTGTSTLPQLTGSFLSGFGLSTCDPTTGKLTWANGVFGCGTDGGGSGSQTPWTSAINAAGYDLTNAGAVTGTYFTATSATASTFPNASTTNLSVSSNANFNTASFAGAVVGEGDVAVGSGSSFVVRNGSNNAETYIFNAGGSGLNDFTINAFTGPAFSMNDTRFNFTGGNVGIGTTTPADDFAVNGGGFFSDILTALGIFTARAGATILDFLDIPSGTNPTVDAEGEIALDTTDNQLLVGDSGGTAFVAARKVQKIWSATVASTSQAFIDGGLLPVPTELDGYTMTAIRCKVDGGTSKVVAVEDASANSTEDITCGTSVTSDDGSITNAAATAAEEMYIDFGATSGSVNYVTISVFGTITGE